jgi:hypothetical protein
MPHSHKLSKRHLLHIARCVSEKLTSQSIAVLSENGSIEIGGTFEVWYLSHTATLRMDARLVHVARRTGYWHHQIKHNGEAREYALSQPYGPSARDWEVHAVMSSDLPAEIEKAVSWLEKQKLKGDPLVRLLASPAYQVTAFWLDDGDDDKIVIVARPEWFPHLKTGRFYDKREFLAALARIRPARAVPRWGAPRTSAPRTGQFTAGPDRRYLMAGK